MVKKMAENGRLLLDDQRLFPCDSNSNKIATELFMSVRNLPIISPHGHTDPAWFARNKPFTDALSLLVTPDHYVLRMLYSQGVPLEALGVAPRGEANVVDPREGWRTFAANFHLFRGTPSAMWFNHVFAEVFDIEEALSATTADHYFDLIGEALTTDTFRPRALFERFNIEFLATTEGATDRLDHHRALQESGWPGRVVTTYRPDNVVDPEHPEFAEALVQFGDLTGEDVFSWWGYLAAHRNRRAFFRDHGATATDHGHPNAQTADLSGAECEALFTKIAASTFDPTDAELFRAQMLTEMAGMSLEDGMTMQLHPGSKRNHNPSLFDRFGPDKGADIPGRINYVEALRPLLGRFGNEKDLTLILFTLDESTYARELAPLAGHYPALRLGPAWWFHDSPEGMMRYHERVTETAGFYNRVGFNDDTRAFLSIPARHDMARRIDCAYLARLVAEHRLTEDEAIEVAIDLMSTLPRQAYKIDQFP